MSIIIDIGGVDGQNVVVVVVSVSGMLLRLYDEKLSTHERRLQSAL